MDQQTPQQNNPYESISSSIPTFDSFSSQQNMTIEDETIDVETLEPGDVRNLRNKKKARHLRNRLVRRMRVALVVGL
ncbi:hypothetical protein Tco_1331750 [Tanacetum coccineum]